MPHLRYGQKSHHGFIEAIFEPVSSPLVITLTAMDRQRREKSFSLTVESEFNGHVFFNSYYLDDGDHRLTMAVNESRTGNTCTLTKQVCVKNGASGLAQSLRGEFRGAEGRALVANRLDSSYFLPLSDSFQETNYPLSHRQEARPRVLSSQQIADYDSNGYIQLEGVFSRRSMEAARQSLRKVSASESHGFMRGSSNRIVNLHQSFDALKAIYASKLIYDIVSDLFGCQAFPCQSLTFINGSTQDAHQDTVHLTPFPRGLMCGIWIALEDVIPGSGELFYYPGSHHLPAVLCRSHGVPKVDSEIGDYREFGEVYTPAIQNLLAENSHLQPQTFLPKAGDVLIWQENLIHGGSRRQTKDQTRMSMVIHAFAEPALVYYDSTGISGKRDI